MKRLKATATISILGGVLVHLAILTVIQIEGPIQRQPFKDASKVKYLGNLNREAPPAILQQAALFDSAPLFMPTRWNPASQMAEVASLKEATEIFDRFSAEVRLPAYVPGFPKGDLPQFPSGLELPEGPAFVMSRFGRNPPDTPLAVSPGLTLKVKRLDGAALETPLAPVLPPFLQALSPLALWPPAEFYLQISGGIPAGLPMVAQSSGFAEWDQALKGFINSLGFYRQLDDGYYHLLVYP